MKTKPIQKNLEQRSWDEFRKTGLFMFINTILHAFGWALAVEVDSETKSVTKCFPARTKFRGFNNEDQDEMHKRIADYLKNTAANFPQEMCDHVWGVSEKDGLMPGRYYGVCVKCGQKP